MNKKLMEVNQLGPDKKLQKRGRPKFTCRRTAEAELQALNLNLEQAAQLAKDQRKWRSLVDALCASWHPKDR